MELQELSKEALIQLIESTHTECVQHVYSALVELRRDKQYRNRLKQKGGYASFAMEYLEELLYGVFGLDEEELKNAKTRD